MQKINKISSFKDDLVYLRKNLTSISIPSLSVKFKSECQTNRFIDFYFDIQAKEQKIIYCYSTKKNNES
jgi:hypothetical protein